MSANLDLLKIAQEEASGDLFKYLDSIYKRSTVKVEGAPDAILWEGGNAAGGVKGRALELKVIDIDIMTPEGTQAAFRKLVDAKVQAIASPFVLIPVPAMAAVANYKAPYLHGNTQAASLELVRKNLKPRDIVTGKALENAIRAVGATAGSTNAVLHLLAIAREFDLPLEIEAFERLGESTPVIGNLIPGGSYAALDLYKAGGIALVLRELAAGGLLHLNEQGVDGRTMGEIASQANERAGQDVIRPINNPIKKTGGLTVLRGSLAPEGAIVKLAGHERRHHSGPARVFDSEEAAVAARQPSAPLKRQRARAARDARSAAHAKCPARRESTTA
jgi:dihydroxy-acid dehydratase